MYWHCTRLFRCSSVLCAVTVGSTCPLREKFATGEGREKRIRLCLCCIRHVKCVYYFTINAYNESLYVHSTSVSIYLRWWNDCSSKEKVLVICPSMVSWSKTEWNVLYWAHFCIPLWKHSSLISAPRPLGKFRTCSSMRPVWCNRMEYSLPEYHAACR